MEKVKKINKKKENLQGLLFASPPLIAFALFGLLPMILSLILSFFELYSYDIFDAQFVGFRNYIEIFTTDDRFIKSISNTFIYAFFTVFLQIVFSFVLDLILSN